MAKGRAILDISICIIVTTVVFLIILGYIPTSKQGFYCDDPWIRYKFLGDSISSPVILSAVTLGPFFYIFLTEICKQWNCSSYKTLLGNCWRRAMHFYFIYVRGLCFTLSVTVFTSATVGEPRPYFLDTCKPDFTKINCSEGYITNYTCTAQMTRSEFGHLHISFVSGHASLSTYTSLFLCFYIYKNISLFPTYLVAWMCQAFFLVLAFYCSVSRIIDRRHHWWNVVNGCFVGVMCSCYVALKLFNYKLHNEEEPSSLSDSSVERRYGGSKLKDHSMQTVC